MKELIKKLKKYEIHIRRTIDTQMQGNFRSVFKGSGLEFDDVRIYQYGDDVRHIDWNVSAKGHGVFVKNFKEEKEQNIFFILDVSASQNIGKKGNQKLDLAREICGVLALSATKEDSSVGLICFSNKIERYIRPNKGIKHVYYLINNLFKLTAESPHTDLKAAFTFALSMIKRKSIVVILSDFIDKEGYEHRLRSIATHHDLIVIHIGEKRENHFPNIGIVPLFDTESKKTIWMNTSSRSFRKNVTNYYQKTSQKVAQICRRNNANYLYVSTQTEYVHQLVKLFKIRKHKN